MFISLRGNPFKAELDSLQADAMGVGDLPPGMKVGGRQQLAARAPSWDPSHFYSAGSAGPPLGVA
jgi:hypothetical protein